VFIIQPDEARYEVMSVSKRVTPSPASVFFKGAAKKENSMSKWKRFTLNPKKEQFPNKPCVYAIYIAGHLVYVGQTNSLSNRFGGHAFRYGYAKVLITPWGEFDQDIEVVIKAKFSERRGDWAMWEIRLIHRLKPMFNTHHKHTRKGQ
jgi:hypothetical protein